MAKKEKRTDAEMVDHPPHYTQGKFEVVDVIVDAFGIEYELGNVLKYVLRAKHKGDTLTDLRKAQWYLDDAVGRIEREDK